MTSKTVGIHDMVRDAPKTERSAIRPEHGGMAIAPMSTVDAESVPMDRQIQKRNLIICSQDYRPEIDLFRTLATQVVSWLNQCQGRVLAITSCGAGEGKTFMSANLAICLARFINRPVTLVDADLRRPNISKTLGLTVDTGLDTVLKNDLPLKDCMISSEINGLTLLPTKSGLEPSSPLLSTGTVSQLVDEIVESVPDQILLLDLPPILLGDSCAPFLKAADGCLLIVEEGKTTRGHLDRALSLIKPEKLIGVVLNKTSSNVVKEHGYCSYDYYQK